MLYESNFKNVSRATSKNSINSEHFGLRSDSSDVEEPVHFTSTVTSSTRGPGGVGSYLSRQEFGSSEVQPGPDSGYVSHGSGGGYPKLLMQPVSCSLLVPPLLINLGYSESQPHQSLHHVHRPRFPWWPGQTTASSHPKP